jgi:hypothetical protein
MLGKFPARAFVCQEIHVQYSFAPARAEHCCLLQESILGDNINGVDSQCGWKSFVDHDGSISGRLLAIVADK